MRALGLENELLRKGRAEGRVEGKAEGRAEAIKEKDAEYAEIVAAKDARIKELEEQLAARV